MILGFHNLLTDVPIFFDEELLEFTYIWMLQSLHDLELVCPGEFLVRPYQAILSATRIWADHRYGFVLDHLDRVCFPRLTMHTHHHRRKCPTAENVCKRVRVKQPCFWQFEPSKMEHIACWSPSECQSIQLREGTHAYYDKVLTALRYPHRYVPLAGVRMRGCFRRARAQNS